MSKTDEFKGLRQSGYALCTDSEIRFIAAVWKQQGKTSGTCTGMSDFSFVNTRYTFWASEDMVIPADLWDSRHGINKWSEVSHRVCYDGGEV